MKLVTFQQIKKVCYQFITISLLTIVLLTSSCFSSGAKKVQKKTKTPAVKNGTVITPVPEKTTEFPTGNNNSTKTIVVPPNVKPKIPPIERPKTWSEVTDTLPTIETLKPIFNIALMLPFSSQYFLEEKGLDGLPKYSYTALELYEGMLVGLNRLNEMGEAIFEVKVFDTEKEPNKVAKILAEPSMQNLDLIVGPVYNSSLKLVADFANRQNVYQVSPLSPSNKIARNNPYYLIANPSIETQCAAMYDYITATNTNAQLVTVCNNKPKELKLADVFMQLNQMEQKNQDLFNPTAVKQFIITGSNQEDLESYLVADKENVVVVTSFNELFVNDMIRRLHLLRKKYNITIFGMPNWLKMNTLSLDHLANLNFHVTAPSWSDGVNNLEHAQFQQLYLNKFRTYPSAYASQGFDLMLYLGKMLQQYGRQFGTKFEEATLVKGLYNEYDFQPASKHQYQSPFYTLDYYENKFVNILRYNQDFVLEKVK